MKEKGVDVELLKSVGPITPQSIPQILWQHPQILPEGIRNKLIQKIQDFSTNIFVDIATGIAFNLIANRLYPAIRTKPITTRWPLRFSLFTLPFGGTYPILDQKIAEYKELVDTAAKTVEGGKKALEAKQLLK